MVMTDNGNLDRVIQNQEYELQKKLAREYEAALQDVQTSMDNYFARFEKRDVEYWNKLQNGTIKPPAGKTIEQHYADWRTAQVGRGEKWRAQRDDLTRRIVQANLEAEAIINATTPSVAATAYRHTAHMIESYVPVVDLGNGRSVRTSFSLLNEHTVKRLNSGVNHVDFKVSDGKGGYTFRKLQLKQKKDYNWNSKRIQSELQRGIAAGESTDKIANRFYNVMGSNKKAAVRNARTAITSARNAGTMEAYKDAAELGIKLQVEWMATADSRTRDTHRWLHGVRIELDEVFPNGCRFPGDPKGEPAEVYNCRCTTRAVIPGTKSEKAMGRNNQMAEDFKNVQKYNEQNEKMAFTESENGGIMYKSGSLNTINDPMVEVFGSAEESNPKEVEEFLKEIAESKVEFIRAKYEKLGYTPSSYSGTPGTLYISEGASYSAWCHEMQHMRDAKKSGWKSASELMQNKKLRYEFERRAYRQEIELAKRYNRKDMVKRLRILRNNERRRIYGYED